MQPVTTLSESIVTQMEDTFLQPMTSSSDSSSISNSTDSDIIRIVMKEIAEYLQSIQPLNTRITEPVLQRIATIIISHLNTMNERLLLTNFRRIDREDLMGQLRRFAGKRNKILRGVEQYLHGRFVDHEDHHPQCLSIVADELANMTENQEVVLQRAQKKQNNEQGNVLVGVSTGRSSVIVQQQSSVEEENSCHGADSSGSVDAERNEVEEDDDDESTGDLMQLENETELVEDDGNGDGVGQNGEAVSGSI